MCGIVGLIYHTPEQYRGLGSDLLSLMQPLESRGPDSCGVAVYRNQVNSNSVEIYKDVGSAKRLAQKYGLEDFSGSHGIGHTRMATESIVDTNHCHPFTAGFDLSIVHNGQISNYYKLRFQLEQTGAVFETNNDSEVIAHSIHHQLQQGKSLETALKKLVDDLDGTYTFLVATQDQVGLLRDKFAAKPAVIYETPKLVAIASEYQALMSLPGFDATATVREPDAGEVNIWSVLPALQEKSLQACAA